MNKVQESIEKNIEKLNIDAKAKTALYQIQTIARSDASLQAACSKLATGESVRCRHNGVRESIQPDYR